jgi:hypothetical protein
MAWKRHFVCPNLRRFVRKLWREPVDHDPAWSVIEVGLTDESFRWDRMVYRLIIRPCRMLQSG